jgi:hypothetical protein
MIPGGLTAGATTNVAFPIVASATTAFIFSVSARDDAGTRRAGPAYAGGLVVPVGISTSAAPTLATTTALPASKTGRRGWSVAVDQVTSANFAA